MPRKKRNLEKIESVANASTTDGPRWERGEAAAYLRELIARAERGELPRVNPASGEEKSEARREFEGMIAKIANRICHRAETEEANGTAQRAHTEVNQTGADDEPTDELLARLLRKTNLVSDKVH